MKGSAFDTNESKQFIDDNDTLRVYNEIKEMFKLNCLTFD